MEVNLFILSAGVICIWMHILFIIACARKDNSIVDVGWGLGFIIVGLIGLWRGHNYTAQNFLILSMTIVWALRISTHILIRNWGKGEDPRYKAWRIAWKDFFFIRSYLQIFILQGLMLWIISLPIIFKLDAKDTFLSIYDYIGFYVWLIGLVCESIADYQLMHFLKDPLNKGHVMKAGLWKYSRHPNYFGEALVWWGFGIMALTSPYGFFALISPVTITILLRFVSGVPLAEAQMQHLPEFKQYCRETNIFTPWIHQKK